MFHLHTDVEGLMYFQDKNGVCAYDNRLIGYAMQDADIVRVFYTQKQMQDFYNGHNFNCNVLGKKLEPIYFWSEERWNKRNKKLNELMK